MKVIMQPLAISYSLPQPAMITGVSHSTQLPNGLINQRVQSIMHKFTFTHFQFCHLSRSGDREESPVVYKQPFHLLVQISCMYLMHTQMVSLSHKQVTGFPKS